MFENVPLITGTHTLDRYRANEYGSTWPDELIFISMNIVLWENIV